MEDISHSPNQPILSKNSNTSLQPKASAKNRNQRRQKRAFNPTKQVSQLKESKATGQTVKMDGGQAPPNPPVRAFFVGASCGNRGAVSMQKWTAEQGVSAPTPGLSENATNAFSSIISPENLAESLQETFAAEFSNYLSSSILTNSLSSKTTSLEFLANQIGKTDVASSYISFTSMILLLQFAAKLKW